MLTPWCRVRLNPLPDREGVLNVEDWAEIRRLHRAEGMGMKALARRLGVARCWPS
jgi:hypothetical protein